MPQHEPGVTLELVSSAEELHELQRLLRYESLPGPDRETIETVHLLDPGPNKLAIVQYLRDETKRTLPDLKRLVDSSPVRIAVDDPMSAEMELSKLGATLDVPPSRNWTCHEISTCIFDAVPTLHPSPDFLCLVQVMHFDRVSRAHALAYPKASTDWRLVRECLSGALPTQAKAAETWIAGDQTLQSYLEASLLIRAIHDIGHTYGGENYIDEIPEDDWKWESGYNANVDLRPKVRFDPSNQIHEVSFFTFSKTGTYEIRKYTDCFERERAYAPVTSSVRIASGRQGYYY